MDKALLRGEQIAIVSRRFGVSEDALGRHRKHAQLVIAKAAAAAEHRDPEFAGPDELQTPFELGTPLAAAVRSPSPQCFQHH
jgi:hypothetical protein